MNAVVRALARAGLAVWDFFVGDTPEVLVVTLAIVGITFAIRAHNHAAVVVVPICSALALIAVVWLGRVRVGSKRSEPEEH
jgi:asparagine N-glycosylation enzyme membrane subunit Stt3